MILSVCFPVKVSHFTMSFLDYKKVDYDTNCFSLTPHVLSTGIKKTKKKQCAPVSDDRYYLSFCETLVTEMTNLCF